MYYQIGENGIDERMLTGYHNITDTFVIKIDGKIEAIIFYSINDDKNAYYVNIAYNMQYSHYGIGIILYYYCIEKMIERGIKTIYLGGYYYDYKKESKAIRTETMKGDILFYSPIKSFFKFIYSSRKRFIYTNKKAYWQRVLTILGFRFTYEINKKRV